MEDEQPETAANAKASGAAHTRGRTMHTPYPTSAGASVAVVLKKLTGWSVVSLQHPFLRSGLVVDSLSARPSSPSGQPSRVGLRRRATEHLQDVSRQPNA